MIDLPVNKVINCIYDELIAEYPNRFLVPEDYRQRTKAQLFLIGPAQKEFYVIVGERVDGDRLSAKSTRLLLEDALPLGRIIPDVEFDNVVSPWIGWNVKHADPNRRITVEKQFTYYVYSLAGLRKLLEWYAGESANTLAAPGTPTTSDVVRGNKEGDAPSPDKKRRAMSESELLDILKRQRENGAAGERFAIEWELKRLRDTGCSTPDKFVRHLSETDVGAGFDIHSNWTAEQERFIEVKATSTGADHFFMSENERQVLTEKGSKSYIYIVHLDSVDKTIGEVKKTIDFAEAIDLDKLEFEPIAYRVSLK